MKNDRIREKRGEERERERERERSVTAAHQSLSPLLTSSVLGAKKQFLRHSYETVYPSMKLNEMKCGRTRNARAHGPAESSSIEDRDGRHKHLSRPFRMTMLSEKTAHLTRNGQTKRELVSPNTGFPVPLRAPTHFSSF